MSTSSENTAIQKANILRTTLMLAAVALAFFVGSFFFLVE